MRDLSALLAHLPTVRARNRALRDLEQHRAEQRHREAAYAGLPAAVTDTVSKGRTDQHADPTAKRAAFTADWKEGA